jgi:hypothetical protein
LSQTTSPVNPSARSLPATEAQVRADDRAHVFHSWSAQAQIDPLPIATASGSYFSDYQGKRYLDFSSQLVNVNIGYQHPKLVAAIQEQAAKLCTISPAFANDRAQRGARLIAEVAPETSTPSSSPTVGPTPTRTRSGWRGCTPGGTRSSPPTAATTAPPPAPLRSRVTRAAGLRSRGARGRPLLGPVRLSFRVPRDHRAGGV